jgi:predicted O-methyltransferase YrrM
MTGLRRAGDAFRRHPRATLDKLVGKTADLAWRRSADEARAWSTSRAVAFEDLAAAIDAPLYGEAVAHAERMADDAASLLAGVPFRFGGGADTTAAYFLVRALRPNVVVETGVAAGWSSRAILEALEANGRGRLWSSDLPTLQHPDAAAHTGVVVPDRLRHRWSLHLDGDRRNLPVILDACGPVDLVHYDSDKTARGRAWAMEQLVPRLSPGAVIVVDDIDDNAWFARWAPELGRPVTVIRSANVSGGSGTVKHVGVVGWPEHTD